LKCQEEVNAERHRVIATVIATATDVGTVPAQPVSVIARDPDPESRGTEVAAEITIDVAVRHLTVVAAGIDQPATYIKITITS